MRLSATERRLKLHDRIAALAAKALQDRLDEQAHPLGDNGALEECDRILVLRRRLSKNDLCKIGGEGCLLERALEDVFVRNDDLTPGQQVHSGSLLSRLCSQQLHHFRTWFRHRGELSEPSEVEGLDRWLPALE